MNHNKIKKISKEIIVLIDTREKKFPYITSHFDNAGIKYCRQKLDYGDYSFYLPANPKLGIKKDVSFVDKIVIERKNSLDELAGNLGRYRKQFVNELTRGYEAGAKMILLIENASLKQIHEKKYRSAMHPNAYAASLASFEAKYGLVVEFVDRLYAGKEIFTKFDFYLREYLQKAA